MTHKTALLIIVFALQFVALSCAAQTPGTVSIAPEGLINKIAPGEFLPVSVKLVNFGSLRRVDVTIIYRIFDTHDALVYTEEETVAVETTASFVKRIPLPPTLRQGLYTAVSDLHYPGQLQPAISRFQFTIERKIGGFFINDLIFYAVVSILAAIVIIGILMYLLTGKYAGQRMVFHEYENKPHAQRIYYEILSDIIAEMRLRIGDDALKITRNIPQLEINKENGRVMHVGGDPAKIAALLIHRYQILLGKPISFGLRKALRATADQTPESP